MANDIISLTQVSPNLIRLNGALGQKLWFSYGVLIAVYIGNSSTNLHVTPVFHSVTTTKHLNTVKRWGEENGFTVLVADNEDTLNGWAA